MSKTINLINFIVKILASKLESILETTLILLIINNIGELHMYSYLYRGKSLRCADKFVGYITSISDFVWWI